MREISFIKYCLDKSGHYISSRDEATKISGMGVGMSAVKSELDKLNGTIDIDNKPDIGVKFTINIPILKEEN